MYTKESYFNRWSAFSVQKKPAINPISLIFRVLKWILLVSSIVIFFWGMGTLFFNSDVTVGQVSILNDDGTTAETYNSGVYFEVISGYDEQLKYKQHIFNLKDNTLSEYDYSSVNNANDMWNYSTSPFYVLFVLPISWFLTIITQGLGWSKENLASDRNLAIMILTIFLTSLIIRIITGFGSWKQQKQKQKMESLQTKTQEIKEKYKDNSSFESQQKMQMEIMNLYRQEKINPLSSALEGFAFAPFLFAMFVVVRTSRVIKDSGTFDFSLTTTIWSSLSSGLWIYLIPVSVYLVLLSFDTFLMPRILKKKTSRKIINRAEEKGGIKKFMFKWGFKILFIVFFFLVPTGTSIYWIFSSFFEIIQKFILAFVNKIQKHRLMAQKKGENFSWWNISTLYTKKR